MMQLTEPNYWTNIGHVADIISILGFGLIGVAASSWKFVRKWLFRPKVETNPLGLGSGYKGLVCCVSAPPGMAENIAGLIRDSANPSRDLLNTPLGTIFKAMNLHGKYLIHCWLVHSEESLPYLELVEEAAAKYFPQVTTHRVMVSDVDFKIDSVYDATRRIFRSCAGETGNRVQPRDIVTDITSGNKIMSVAMALACMADQREIEYMEQKNRKEFFKIDIAWSNLFDRPAENE